MCTTAFRVGAAAAGKELGCESWGGHMDLQGVPAERGKRKARGRRARAWAGSLGAARF